ncbi:MAG: hypothetical protein M0R22_13195, partial [Dehalococcoidia bacterium]|nr:hypothetical protein [Dehalococcoidia bacterium]
MIQYNEWVALCASDPARANAICAERMGWERDTRGPFTWWVDRDGNPKFMVGCFCPITSRDHAAMMLDRLYELDS